MNEPKQEQKKEVPEDDFANESFDTELRIVSMPVEKIIKLEMAGRVKDPADYEG